MKLKSIFLLFLSMASLLLLSGCKAIVWNPQGVISLYEKHIIITAAILILIVVIPVIVLSVVIAYRYRESNKKAKYTPEWSHSNTLEAVWWGIPCIIIVILAVVTWISTHWLDPYKSIDTKAMGYNTKAVKIDVVALRWKWLFIYPQYNIATVNFIEFPVNTQVSFSITSDAPMNAIQIAQLGGQIYSMNGMVTKLHLLATKKGDYSGRSVSFSGTGFAGMLFTARVTDQATFKQWVQQVKSSASPLNKATYNQLAQPSEYNKVQYFAPVVPNLYKDIVQKFASPDRHNVDTNVSAVSL